MKYFVVFILFLLIMCNDKDSEYLRKTVIEVSGKAEVCVDADYFKLNPKIYIFSDDHRVAYDSVKTLSEKIVESVLKIDSTAKVEIEYLNVETVDRWGRQESKRGNYKADISIEISSTKLEQASKIFENCIELKATDVRMPTFISLAEDSLRNFLRKEAYKNARENALKIAKSYNGKLGNPIVLRGTNVYPAKIETIDEKVFGMEAPRRGYIGGLMGGSLLNELVLKEKKVTITEVVEAYYELKLQGE